VVRGVEQAVCHSSLDMKPREIIALQNHARPECTMTVLKWRRNPHDGARILAYASRAFEPRIQGDDA
jgi:hypothetical protein